MRINKEVEFLTDDMSDVPPSLKAEMQDVKGILKITKKDNCERHIKSKLIIESYFIDNISERRLDATSEALMSEPLVPMGSREAGAND